VGVAPSVHRDLRELLVESYLYDFSGNLYGETMSVEFLSFVRDELVFGTVAELKDKIDEDLRTVRALHAI
jgi:riboflavin kinase/FMN adenylyltransferase